ncbi:MAG: hypothetical protein HY890_07365 [Deltaproteobacteria bacterium]|nr:hypothetical protein [Deltaproteobacteria bacterium]
MYTMTGMTVKKTHTIGAKVDEKTYNSLRSAAKKTDRTVSYLVGKILEEWLERQDPANSDVSSRK